MATPEPKEKVKEVVYKGAIELLVLMHQSICSSCVCPGDPKEILHLKQVTQRQQECTEMQWDNVVCCALWSKSLQTTMDSDTIRYCGGFALCARKRFPDCFLPSMSSASAWRTFESYAQGLVGSVQFRIVGMLVFSTLLGSKRLYPWMLDPAWPLL